MDVSTCVTGRFQAIRWVAQTGSTNADLRPLAQEDPDTAQVLFTDEQTAGRGRRQRRWTMRSGGGIMVSFYVPWRDPSTAHGVNTALAVAVVETVGEISGVPVKLKWPNDVVVDSADGTTHKLAGILAEGVANGSTASGVIAGLGLNVSWPTAADRDLAPVDLGGAVSLDELAETPTDRELLASRLVANFDALLAGVATDGTADLHRRYEEHSSTIGRRVRVEQVAGFTEGSAVALDASGALILDTGVETVSILAGDVVHLRDAPHAPPQ